MKNYDRRFVNFFNMKLNGAAASFAPNASESQAEISWMTRRTARSSEEFAAALSTERGAAPR
jgi:hypothetical protein